ncbi:MAG: 3-hydroxyisobutyrate dehydrogenase-like beta-hydroxyacid dehydrogenase [Gammaproteobacteria bacterium]|jgi:3-hydroxyisobutyrate dehydrogenase-like beta-hydroxyacid dehydrogenase
MNDWNRAKAVGIVGVGVMGGGMARNILAGGFPLVAYDVSAAALDDIVARGAVRATSATAVAEQAATLICMVETTAQSESVIVGDGGFLPALRQGDTVISAATIDPVAVKRWYALLAEKGIALLDTPVSGGSVRADQGDLSAIVGGDAAALEAVRPVIEAYASRVFHVGGAGQGLAMKHVNNMMIQTTTAALAEAFVMGAKAGLDPQQMYDVLGVSTGASVALDLRAPRFISGDFSPGGTIDITCKDQGLQVEFAKSLGVPMFMANVSLQIYEMAKARGLSKLDSASVITLYEEMAGIQLGPRQE